MQTTCQYHIIELMLNVRVGDIVVLDIIWYGKEHTVQMTITEECLASY